MSLDYPNRADWLAVRATPRNLRRDRVFFTGGTYCVGNNKRKREKLAMHASFTRAARSSSNV